MIAKMNITHVSNQSTTNNQNVAAVKNLKNTHGKVLLFVKLQAIIKIF